MLKLLLAVFAGLFLSWKLPAGEREPAVNAGLIDKAIDARLAKEKIPASPAADDAEFLRRAFLDLTGRIPSGPKAASFLASSDPAKRAKLMEELLASPEFGQHLATLWVAQMVRKDANMIRPPDTKPLQKWLAQQFNENRPWSEIVREILTVEGPQTEKPQGIYYVLNGDSRGNPEPNTIARQSATLFLGQSIGCAECHNHPLLDWKQTDFWGMAAFFGRVKLSGGGKAAVGAGITEMGGNGGGKGNNAIPIKVGRGASIFIPDTAFKNVGKEVPAKFLNADEASLAETGPFRPHLADWVTSAKNESFSENMVNRIWAQLFGKGFVNPLGDHNKENPASHPELLAELSRDFTNSGFNIKHLYRSICLSRSYQRTSVPVKGNERDEHLFSRMEVKVLTGEQLCASLEIALETSNLFLASKSTNKTRSGGLQQVAVSPREQFIAFYNTRDDVNEQTDFSHGIPQALRLMNSEVFNTGGGLLERLGKLNSPPEKYIELVYLAVYARPPTAEESRDALAFVEKQKTPADGYKGVLWVLLNSSEFMLNH
jgi:hypothetical protein